MNIQYSYFVGHVILSANLNTINDRQKTMCFYNGAMPFYYSTQT